MKRVVTFLLMSCIAVFLLSGCNAAILQKPIDTSGNPGSESIPAEETESININQIMMSALEGSFPILSQSGQYEKLPEYLAQQYYAAIVSYAYVDFNRDGHNEMVVRTDSVEVANVVLYYAAEDLFFFSFSEAQMKQIKSDGTFSGVTGDQLTYSTLEFPGGGYRLQNLAKADYVASVYTVDGVACGEESFVKFEKDWALKQNINWINVESQPVERPETEPVTEPSDETENDGSYRINIPNKDQPIYSGPGYQYTYVGDIGIAGIYTIVQETRDSDNNLWGKLKSGIGWVDLNEVRRLDNPITIDYADPDLLASGNFHRCDDHAGAHSTAVAFRAHETLYNVQIFYNTYNYDYDIEDGYDLFYLKKLTPDKPIVAAISFSDTSVYLISFEDAFGNFYMYEFYESGSDLDCWSCIVKVER